MCLFGSQPLKVSKLGMMPLILLLCVRLARKLTNVANLRMAIFCVLQVVGRWYKSTNLLWSNIANTAIADMMSKINSKVDKIHDSMLSVLACLEAFQFIKSQGELEELELSPPMKEQIIGKNIE